MKLKKNFYCKRYSLCSFKTAPEMQCGSGPRGAGLHKAAHAALSSRPAQSRHVRTVRTVPSLLERTDSSAGGGSKAQFPKVSQPEENHRGS